MSRPPGDPLPRDLADGREEAFELLYERFGAKLFRAALGMLSSREEAEDVVQDVFVSLVRSCRRLDKVDNLPGYLFASLRRAAARRAARLQREREALKKARPERSEMQRDGGPGGHSDRLERALRSLPLEQREVIVLKIDAGLTFAEMADTLGISQNTAASRYRYALEKLRAALQEEQGD